MSQSENRKLKSDTQKDIINLADVEREKDPVLREQRYQEALSQAPKELETNEKRIAELQRWKKNDYSGNEINK